MKFSSNFECFQIHSVNFGTGFCRYEFAGLAACFRLQDHKTGRPAAVAVAAPSRRKRVKRMPMTSGTGCKDSYNPLAVGLFRYVLCFASFCIIMELAFFRAIYFRFGQAAKISLHQCFLFVINQSTGTFRIFFWKGSVKKSCWDPSCRVCF